MRWWLIRYINVASLLFAKLLGITTETVQQSCHLGGLMLSSRWNEKVISAEWQDQITEMTWSNRRNHKKTKQNTPSHTIVFIWKQKWFFCVLSVFIGSISFTPYLYIACFKLGHRQDVTSKSATLVSVEATFLLARFWQLHGWLAKRNNQFEVKHKKHSNYDN